MTTNFLLFATIAAALLAASGCNKSSAPPASSTAATPAELEPWQIKRNQLRAVIKVGMTQDEVTKAVGDPNRVKSIGIRDPVIIWQYKLPDTRWFNVRFSADDRVVSAELDGSAMSD
jgi:outer membrane protein assembly factor BamE (lipoprotein component of BamABCDE complex)